MKNPLIVWNSERVFTFLLQGFKNLVGVLFYGYLQAQKKDLAGK